MMNKVISSPITLQFLGGAGTVTGSKTLVEFDGHRILVDCGLFQGLKELRLKNWQNLPVSPASIQAVILTHAHLDHCGYLPILARTGFRGPVTMTPPTRDLTEIILRDSARLQEEDARYANEKKFSKHHPAEPLYTEADAEAVIRSFRTVPDETWHSLEGSADLRFRLRRSGHILGSVFVEIEAGGTRVVFSGDLGRPHPLLIDPPVSLEKADALVLESTYGDRLHPSEHPDDQLAKEIRTTLSHGGTVLIPCFAVSRAQDMMYYLYRLRASGRIPEAPIFLDSPMAIRVTQVMKRHRDWYKLPVAECEAMCRDIHYIEEFKDTLRVAGDPRPKIVIAGAGMLTGGRILHYLEIYLDDHRASILLAGYQAIGTRGRALVDGAREIKLHGRFYPVRCRVVEIHGLSAHADQAETLAWLKSFREPPRRVILNHGEAQALDALRVKISDEWSCPVDVAHMGETLTLA